MCLLQLRHASLQILGKKPLRWSPVHVHFTCKGQLFLIRKRYCVWILALIHLLALLTSLSAVFRYISWKSNFRVKICCVSFESCSQYWGVGKLFATWLNSLLEDMTVICTTCTALAYNDTYKHTNREPRALIHTDYFPRTQRMCAEMVYFERMMCVLEHTAEDR